MRMAERRNLPTVPPPARPCEEVSEERSVADTSVSEDIFLEKMDFWFGRRRREAVEVVEGGGGDAEEVSPSRRPPGREASRLASAALALASAAVFLC